MRIEALMTKLAISLYEEQAKIMEKWLEQLRKVESDEVVKRK